MLQFFLNSKISHRIIQFSQHSWLSMHHSFKSLTSQIIDNGIIFLFCDLIIVNIRLMIESVILYVI